MAENSLYRQMGIMIKVGINRLALGLALAILVTDFIGAHAADYDYGIFASAGKNVNQSQEWQALGPIVENRADPNGSTFFAIRPFYSSTTSPIFERSRREYLWPLASVKHFKNERSWRVLVVAHGINFDLDDDEGPYRTRILPIYFQGRNSDGIDYLGIFPLGGKIYDILGRDQVAFFLFPIWMQHSVNDVKTTDWLWPIFSKTTGPGIERFRVFPLYGSSIDENRYRKRFILWPFWTQAEWFTPGESGSGYILFPLFGRTRTEIERTVNVLPPFFRFTRGERRNLTYAPWPFYQRVVGDEIDKLYIWPLWGRKIYEDYRSSFLLWPIGWRDRLEKSATEQVRTMFIPFYYDFGEYWKDSDQDDEAVSRYLKIWPIFSYQRDPQGSRFDTLALWPSRDPDPIERNWAPLWRIYTRSQSAHRFESELLWGIYRNQREGETHRSTTIFPLVSWDRDGEQRGWSLLNGLVASEKNGTNTTWRLLYIFKFGKDGAKK